MALKTDPNTSFAPKNDPPPTPRKRGRWARVATIGLIVVVGLLAAAPTVAGWVARGRIESAVRDALEADVSIGALSLGWLSGLEVGDVDVKPRADGKPGFSIGSIAAKPTLGALLQGRVEVNDLVIRHVTVHLSSSPDEKEEEEEEEDEAEDETKPVKTVPDFGVQATIEDVTVVYADRRWAKPIRVDHLGPVRISATSKDATRVEIVGGRGLTGSLDVLWAKDGKQLRKREHVLSGELTLDHVDLEDLQGAVAPWLESLGGFADGKIRIQMNGKALSTTGNLRLTGASALMRGASEAHALSDVTVQHDVKRGLDKAWAGQVELGAAKAYIAPVSALGRPLAIERLDLKARLDGNIRVGVERLSVKAEFGSIEGSGQVATGKEPFATSAQVEARAGIENLVRWIGGMPAMTGALASNVTLVMDPAGMITVRGSTRLTDFGAREVRGVGSLNEREIVLKHDLDWGSDVLRMHDVALSSSFATAKCTGAIQPKSGGAAPEGQVDVAMTADLAIIAALLGENLAIKPKGKLAAAGRISGAADGMAFDMRVTGDAITLAEGPFAVAPLDLGKVQAAVKGRLAADRNRLAVSEYSLRSRVGFAAGALDAAGLGNAHPHLTASLSGQIEPDLLLPSFSATPRKRKIGTVDFSTEIAGDDAAHVVKVTKLTAAGLSVDLVGTFPHDDVPAGAPTMSGKLALVLEKVVPHLSEEAVASGTVRGSFTGMLGVRPAIDAKLTAENLRLQSAPGGSTISGNAEVDAKVDQSRAFTARISSPSLTFTGADRKSVSGAVSVLAEGSHDGDSGVIDLKNVTGTGPGLKFGAKARLEPGESVTFDVLSEVTAAEAGPVLAFLAPSLKVTGTGVVAANGTLSLAEGGMRDSKADFSFRLGGLKAEMLDLKDVDFQASLDGGIGKTRKATAGLNGGTAQLDATIDFRPAAPEWKGNVRLDRVQITKEMQPAIARVVPVFAGIAVTLTGVIGSTLDLSGRGDDWESVKPTLSGTGTIAGSDVRLSKSDILDAIGQFVGVPRDVDFEPFETRFRIQDGAVHQDRLVLACPQMDLRMSGVTTLEGRLHYNVAVRAKGAQTEQWKKFGKLLDREGFLAVMRLEGDVTRPSFKLPKVEDLLGGAVEDILKGGLEDLFKKKKKKGN